VARAYDGGYDGSIGRSRGLGLAVIGAALALARPAGAQPVDPKFKYEAPKPDEPADERKLQVRGGLVQLSGNSRVLTATMGATGSYRAGSHRLAAEATAAHARTSFLDDTNANTMLEPAEVETFLSRTTSKLYAARARYDLFLTENNSAYFSGQALSDVPAGKQIVAGGQIGYSRQLVLDERHRTVAELGYDLSFEKATAAGAGAVQVHSARAFVGEELKLSDATGILLSLELLTNLNEEGAPATGYPTVAAFDDTRLNARIGLTTTLWKNVAFGFTVGARYDHAPAPLKPPAGITLAPGFFPLAETLDTTSEASLVITFL
jgi:hypothetical protein